VAVLAAPSSITLGSLAPPTSTWSKALLDMGAAWKKDTAGSVSLTVIPPGTDDEKTIIQKMRTDVYQAAFLTSVGLSEMESAFNIFAVPFFFESNEEEAAVEKTLTPLMETYLNRRGLHLLAWGEGGWVQVFSKKPLKTLADVKGAKLFTSKGSDKWVKWYVQNKFNPVPLDAAAIPGALKLANGQIDTVPYTPLLALNMHIYDDAKFMLDLRLAPLTGALVVTETAWNRLAAGDRDKITAGAQAFEARLRKEVPMQDAGAVTAMKSKGLQVITPDAHAVAEFRAAGSQLSETMRGSMVPDDVYKTAVEERDAFRKSKGK
jgi:TRAP-type C4-dicarboxylate transport system substrate-binding protein